MLFKHAPPEHLWTKEKTAEVRERCVTTTEACGKCGVCINCLNAQDMMVALAGVDYYRDTLDRVVACIAEYDDDEFADIAVLEYRLSWLEGVERLARQLVRKKPESVINLLRTYLSTRKP